MIYLLKHLLDTVFGLSADLWPGVRLEVQVALEYAVEDLLLTLTPKRGHSTEQDVQDDTTAPDVCLVAVMPPQNLHAQLQDHVA